MKFGQYYRVLFDPNPNPVTDPVAPVVTTPVVPVAEPVKPTTPAPTDGVIPLGIHQEKVDRLHGDLSKERGTIKTLREENEALKKENGGHLLEKKKSSAFDTAFAGLGEDFEIPADKVPKVKEFLARLPDSETLSDEVVGFLDLVKAPKAKANPIRNPFSPNAPVATAQTNAPKSLGDMLSLAMSNPEAFKQALNSTS